MFREIPLKVVEGVLVLFVKERLQVVDLQVTLVSATQGAMEEEGESDRASERASERERERERERESNCQFDY